MPQKNLVIVESPAKAKTIQRVLGQDFRVMATLGHIRDLPTKKGMVDPERDFAMHWELLDGRATVVKDVAKALKQSSDLYLATDPDREGEAIAWHLCEMLKSSAEDQKITFKRIVFHEVTPRAIKNALNNPRTINQDLVDAYLGRRALDYLVGFTLSPVLWRKLPGTRSAGRVQSVALRLICEREQEIQVFKNQEYWSISGSFAEKKQSFKANLKQYDGKKLTRLSISQESEAHEIKKALEKIPRWTLSKVEQKEVSRHPAPPFTTSTLQQESSRKLGFSASKTMKVAQSLYEGILVNGDQVGLITYMRTDSTNVSQDAITQMRTMIDTRYGKEYLPEKAQFYRNKSRNAQEAHEAIRPTNVTRIPGEQSELTPDQAKLYALIWKRALASQMMSAKIAQSSLTVADDEEKHQWRASGSQITFDGFIRLYTEGKDDEDEKDESKDLPNISQGSLLSLGTIETLQHFTQPPPRFNEASLVRKLEELGIGRPSTYTAIMHVIRDRDYAILEQRRFKPTSKGQLLSGFLVTYFGQYVAYEFTAHVEEQLDKIANRELERLALLNSFWQPFHSACEQATALRNRDVLEVLDQQLEPLMFPEANPETIKEERTCPRCQDGRLSLKSGRYGGFIGCSNYPSCEYVVQMDAARDVPEGEQDEYPRDLGVERDTGLVISLRKGRFGLYVQRDAEGDEKPKRATLQRHIDPKTVDLVLAEKLLSLPRTIGKHPDTQEPIISQIGRFGPYVRHKSTFASIPKDETPWSIGLNRAVMLIVEAEKKPKRGSRFKQKATKKSATN